MEMFHQNDDFCPICGTILQLPERMPATVECALCKAKWPARVESGQLITRFEQSYEKPEAGVGEFETDEDVIVEHQCSKCESNEATYTTQQTRSADEGQTVFYQCVKCKHRSIEYS